MERGVYFKKQFSEHTEQQSETLCSHPNFHIIEPGMQTISDAHGLLSQGAPAHHYSVL